jgi:hypothetical protein
MAHAFAPIPAKPTFGTLKESLYQSEYINRKKGKLIYCNANINNAYCNRVVKSGSYDNINTYNNGRYAIGLDNCNIIPCNKGNLVVGQYSELNLKNVCVSVPFNPSFSDPNYYDSNTGNCIPCLNTSAENTKINVNSSGQYTNNNVATPFYQVNTIDPIGALFGNSQCGELNYTQYMFFNPPTNNLNNS